ncbi:MAG TPA: ABC transporter permease [Vicinamibacterales bacterium]|jgi:predicted permease
MSFGRQDVRHAIRAFARTPVFTVAAIMSIAIGVGANTAIYSVASALLLHPLPYKDSDRLVILWNRSPGLGIAEDWFSTAQYFDVKNGHSGFDEVAIAIGGTSNLTGDGEPERIGTIRMSSNLLPMLGARTQLGRLFTAGEDAPGQTGTAILRHATWVRRYGADPGIIGRTIRLNDQPYQIVGILEKSFSLPREVMPTLNGAEDADVVLPLPLAADAATRRDREDYNIVGRLKRDESLASARAEMDSITARLRREHPDLYPPNGGLTFGIVPLQEQVVGDVRRALLILMGSVAFVLLIACANVANLQLARVLGRQKEFSVRAALGASRSRLAGQVIGESVLLAVAGGALGVVLAAVGLALIRTLGAQSVPRLSEVAINGEVLAFTLAASVASGALFGLAPALRIGGLDVNDGLKDTSRGASIAGSVWSRGNSGRRLLVALELALSVVLLVGAGLLIRSFVELQRVWPGFESRQVLTFELALNGRRYTEAAATVELHRRMLERLGRIPGVAAVGSVSALPLSQMFAWGPVTIEGRVPAPGEAFINADVRTVAGRYFDALRIPVVAGRVFDEHDVKSGQPVVVVDSFMAEQLWPSESALGKRLRFGGAGSTSPWLTVVGVVGRVKQYTLDADSRIAMYFAHAQFPVRSMNVAMRTDGDPVSVATAVRGALREVDPDLPVYRLLTMDARVAESLARRRFAMSMLTVFAALALGLAVVGVYGVMAYLVGQGHRELGIRLALGASRGAILGLVMRRGLTVALGGVVAGLLGAVALTRFIEGLLFGIRPHDLLTFSAIPVILGLTTVLAVYGPARRASRTDPLQTLRSE